MSVFGGNHRNFTSFQIGRIFGVGQNDYRNRVSMGFQKISWWTSQISQVCAAKGWLGKEYVGFIRDVNQSVHHPSVWMTTNETTKHMPATLCVGLITNWGFPKMGVPLNHSCIDGFALLTKHIGVPSLWKPPIGRGSTSCVTDNWFTLVDSRWLWCSQPSDPVQVPDWCPRCSAEGHWRPMVQTCVKKRCWW